jgi:hypothetical protein
MAVEVVAMMIFSSNVYAWLEQRKPGKSVSERRIWKFLAELHIGCGINWVIYLLFSSF